MEVSRLIILLILSVSVSYADTIPATKYYHVGFLYQYPTALQTCNAKATASAWTPPINITTNNYCYDNTSHGVQVVTAYWCPTGGTLNGTNCINYTPPIVQNCPAGEYKNSSNVCVPITTDCNANMPTGGNFFDVATQTCLSQSPLVLCIAQDSNGSGGNNSVYCPPLNDCVPPGQICSNNQASIDAKAATRVSEVAAAKAKADTAAAEAAQAKADKDTAKAAKDAAATASAAQSAAAQAAAQAAAAQGTTSTTAIQAAQAAAQAAQRQAADAIAAANAAAQGLIVDIQEAIAGDRQGQINAGQGSLGGNMAGDLGQQAEKAAEKAKAAAWGAQGGYAPDGQPSAGETGIPQQTDCPDCAKEGTLQGIKNDLEKADNEYSGEPAGTATLEASNTKLVNALKGHFTLPNIAPIAADCPVFTQLIPFINVTLTIDQFCTMEPMIRPYIEGAVTVMYSIMGLFIVLGA